MGAPAKVRRPLRVVIDTNVVVSALVFRQGRLAWLREAWASGAIVPVVSDETLAELVRVLAYPKLGLETGERKNALTYYMEHAETLKSPRTRARLPQCRDPKDQMFLRLAYAAKADFVVTGDNDLVALTDASRVPIILPRHLQGLLDAG